MLPTELPTGCHVNEAGNRWALYDAELDLMVYETEIGALPQMVKEWSVKLSGVAIGWNLREPSCSIPPTSYCANCEAEIFWKTDYLCVECRD